LALHRPQGAIEVDVGAMPKRIAPYILAGSMGEV
jgi:hypothetical protein